MEQIINIDLLKENPQLFFSQLPKKAEDEITEFLRFVIFKYNIVADKFESKNETTNLNKDFLNFIENNKIKLPKDYKFNREEAHER